MPVAVHVAETVGPGVGGGSLLQRTLPAEPEGPRMTEPMRITFSSREELEYYLRTQFPEAAERDGALSPIRGGHSAALERMEGIDPVAYARTRNFLDGAVTGLSPYIRHGVLTLAGVWRHACELLGERRERAAKFASELAWRDYWQRLYAEWGDGVWQDREAYKTGHDAGAYAGELPGEIADGRTGLACMDAFATELRRTGYLHNHARMWVAAYVVHWRQVRWQAGARWFLTHLLDGDAASNNLSWQWVASTFSHKPYFFNRENLEKYTGGRYCRQCRAECPFQGPYEELGRRLFPIL